MSDAKDLSITIGETSDSGGGLKKSRRQAAFYPNTQNKPSMPFSKSAAKRESVMALGSIEHLQHYFTKAGLTSRRSGKQMKGLVPAIGPAVIPTLEFSAASPSTSTTFEMPPSPVLPTAARSPYPMVDRVYPQTDPQTLKPALIRDLEETEKAWKLGEDRSPAAEPKPSGVQLLTAANVKKSTADFFEVLSALQTTTKTIRAVRNYLVSLPEDHNATTSSIRQERPGGTLRTPSTTKRSSLLSAITPAPPPVPFPVAQKPDPHAQIRKAAMDVLAMLRLLEESCRIPLSDDAYDTLSVGSGTGDVPLSVSDEFLSTPRSYTPQSGGSSNITGAGSLFSGDEDDGDSLTSASMSQGGSSRRPSLPASRPKPAVSAFVPMKGSGGTVHVWADEEDDLNDLEDDQPGKKKEDGWDQRLVLGGGWLYKQMPLSGLVEQRAVVAKYLDIVDEVLFIEKAAGRSPLNEQSDPLSSPPGYRRGWQRVKASLPPTNKIRRTRSSIGPSSPTMSEASGPTFSGPSSLRRVGSTGLFNAFKGEIVAEPEEMDTFLGDVAEGEEDEDDEFEDSELPEWAKRTSFEGDYLARLHIILTEHLPPHLLNHLPPYSFSAADKIPFLTRLSDGQLLCLGYNAVVRASRKQWGFIGATSIHDILGLEERERAANVGGAGKKTIGWTFRRMENLRLWAAALKLRYLVALAPPPQVMPIQVPPTLSPSPSQPSSPSKSPPQSRFMPSISVMSVSRTLTAMGTPALFDARIIAKREEGWLAMLEVALERWVDAVVRERREKTSHLI